MTGAYCILDTTNCTTKCVSAGNPGRTGQHVFVPTANPGVFNACNFWDSHPNTPWPRPTCCNNRPPPPVTEPPGPPPEEPPEGCGPPTPVVPPPTIKPKPGPITGQGQGSGSGGIGGGSGSGGFGGGGSGGGGGGLSAEVGNAQHSGWLAGEQGGFGDSTLDQMAQPLVIGVTPLSLVDDDDFPLFTVETYVDIKDEYNHAAVHAIHEGTGPGVLVYHSPELLDFMTYGDGVKPDSKWPASLSASAVLIHNQQRDDAAHGDDAVTFFGFGFPLQGTVKPGIGQYFDYAPKPAGEATIMSYNATDEFGADSILSHFRFNIAVDLGQFTTAQLSGLNPRAGSILWNTTSATPQFFNGSDWINFEAGGAGQVNTASNVGVGDGWFKQKVGDDLEFKSVLGSTNLTVSVGADELTLTPVGLLVQSSNLSDLDDDDTAIANLIGGSTLRVPAPASLLPIQVAGAGGNATVQTVLDTVFDLTAKVVPVDADTFLLTDSAASDVAKKVTFADLKSALGAVVTKVKTVDQTYVNQTTFQDDNTFQFDVEAGKSYYWSMLMRINSSTAADFKFDWNGGTAGITQFEAGWSAQNRRGGSSNPTVWTNHTVAQQYMGNTYPNILEIFGSFIVSTSGTVIFRHAQVSANAAATGVFAGSGMLFAEAV